MWRPGGRRQWSAVGLAGVGLLILLGVAAFSSVPYLPSALVGADEGRAVVVLVLRLSGFGFFLGAGYLIVRQRLPD